MIHMICNTGISRFYVPQEGKNKTSLKNPTPVVENYKEKGISKLPESDEKSVDPKHFNRKFSSHFSALWIRPMCIIIITLIY